MDHRGAKRGTWDQGFVLRTSCHPHVRHSTVAAVCCHEGQGSMGEQKCGKAERNCLKILLIRYLIILRLEPFQDELFLTCLWMQCLSCNFRWLLQCIFPLPASCLINWPLKFKYLFLDISHMLSNCRLHIRHCEYYIVGNSGFCCISVKRVFNFLTGHWLGLTVVCFWTISSDVNFVELCWSSGLPHACMGQEFAGLMHALVRSLLNSWVGFMLA